MRNPSSSSRSESSYLDGSAEAANGDTARADSWNNLLRTAPPNSLYSQASSRLSGKRILITGAGGSIGSSLTLAALASAPASLILLDSSESALYQIDRSLRNAGSHNHVALFGSVCNRSLLSHLFKQHRPQIVFHAAALKHVPLMEQNSFAAIENNALGTLALADAAIAHRAEQLILVSTDKAVDPHSIMGASKRIAELILLTLATPSTRLTIVRLCNVLGSQGSVLPLFLDQIAGNRRLTVTHPDAQRFFITLDHAVQALFAALEVQWLSALLVPNPGAPLRILDLAHHLLRSHKSAAAIEFTGLRPGDKLSERLLSSREHRIPNPTGPTSILQAIESPTATLTALHAALSGLRAATQTHNLPQLLAAIQALVPEYHPSSVITNALTNTSALAPASELHA